MWRNQTLLLSNYANWGRGCVHLTWTVLRKQVEPPTFEDWPDTLVPDDWKVPRYLYISTWSWLDQRTWLWNARVAPSCCLWISCLVASSAKRFPSNTSLQSAMCCASALGWEMPFNGPYNPLCVNLSSLSSQFNILHWAATQPPQWQSLRTQWCLTPSVTFGAISASVCLLRRKFLRQVLYLHLFFHSAAYYPPSSCVLISQSQRWINIEF